MRGFLRDLTWGVAVVAAVCAVIGVGVGVVWLIARPYVLPWFSRACVVVLVTWFLWYVGRGIRAAYKGEL